MSARRANPKFREEKKESTPETVLVIQSSVEDPILNSLENKQKQPKEVNIPRPDDPANMKELPSWMADAIASGEELQITDNPELVGTRVPEDPSLRDGLEIGDEKEVSPIQGELNDLNATRLEKKELIARAKFLNASLKEEREYYSQQRKRRAIPVLAVPSNMKVYPEDVYISYSPYSVQDLEDINNNDIPLYNKYLIMLEGIHTIGMSPLELTFSDFTFIADARHLQALGDVYFKYPYVCSTCGRPGTYQFNLSSVEFSSLNCEVPLHVRFHTFPEEVFLFAPHTIGDVLHLLKTDKYWRKMGEDYLTTEIGKKLIDQMAINACRCLSHPWEDAYFKLLEASENPKDRAIMVEINKALYHDTEPIKFNCCIPLDKNLQKQMSEATSDLVKGVVSGEVSTITPNEEKKSLPPWMQAHVANEKGNNIKVCGAPNEIDVLAGDIIIPFHRHTVNMEYGIISF